MRAGIGNIVHYVLPQEGLFTSEGAHRPAVVQSLESEETVALAVFPSPAEASGQTLVFVPGVREDGAQRRPGTWHWPEPGSDEAGAKGGESVGESPPAEETRRRK